MLGSFFFSRIKKRCKECDISYVILQRIMIEQLLAGKHSDEDFAWKIVNGRGPMPSYKDTLTENQIWDLTNFIQSLKMKD